LLLRGVGALPRARCRILGRGLPILYVALLLPFALGGLLLHRDRGRGRWLLDSLGWLLCGGLPAGGVSSLGLALRVLPLSHLVQQLQLGDLFPQSTHVTFQLDQPLGRSMCSLLLSACRRLPFFWPLDHGSVYFGSLGP
jgi:hypothetical protein